MREETEPKFCAVIPTFNNPRTIERVVHAVMDQVGDVVVVDDGSDEPAAQVLDRLGQHPHIHLVRRAKNGGKGAAVKDGLRHAEALGFTHGIQVDADGQHELGDISRLLATSRANPTALVLGRPVFDGSAPKSRTWGRQLSVFWVHMETGGAQIGDPLCGFRVYPLTRANRLRVRSCRMDFDPEFAVRWVWRGFPVVNVATRVRYLLEEEGGVSHFRLFEDNLRIAWMHSRLMMARVLMWLFCAFRSRPRRRN